MLRTLSLLQATLLELRCNFRQALLSCTSLVLGILSIVAVQVVGTVAEASTVRNAELARGRQGTAYVQLDASYADRLKARQLVNNLNGRALVVLDDFGGTATVGDGRAIAVRGYAGSLMSVYPYGVREQLRDGQVLINASGAPLLMGSPVVQHLAPLDLDQACQVCRIGV